MFKKILIANRGEIAVRIIQTCREMGIRSLAIYEAPDQSSLHVRLADECAALDSPGGYSNQDAIIEIARQRGADAIHPGYGFLAERPDFVRACQQAGIAFIGPSLEALAQLSNKLGALQTVRAAGLPTVYAIESFFESHETARIQSAAESIGYPLVIKSCRGGRGRGERLVRRPAQLAEAFRQAQREAEAYYGSNHVFMERAILPAHQINVQILADQQGNLIALGDQEGSLIRGNQIIIEEAPSPALNNVQRAQILQLAERAARLFKLSGAVSVEFLVDSAGGIVFSEIKPRLRIEHPLAELLTRVDLVREQIRIAAGLPLDINRAETKPRGHAMLCRLNAVDPAHGYLPSPGQLRRVRLPAGPEVRVDTYVFAGCHVPAEYDALVAKLAVWHMDRAACLERFRRALEDTALVGVETNLPLIQAIVSSEAFREGHYDTSLLAKLPDALAAPDGLQRDLAAIAAVLYLRRTYPMPTTQPERLTSGWHRDSRQWEA